MLSKILTKWSQITNSDAKVKVQIIKYIIRKRKKQLRANWGVNDQLGGQLK